MTTLIVVLAGVLGMGAGVAVNRAAGRYPWPARRRSWSGRGDTPTDAGVSPPQLHDRGDPTVGRKGAVRTPVVEVGTALLCVLVGLRFGLSWELPAFLFLAGAGVLLGLIDLQHRLLPNRVIVPSVVIGAVLLTLAAAGAGEWRSLLRALIAAATLFVVFLVLALISPRSMGMGDVKLAGLLGLFLGWLGWGAVVLGAAAGFVVQAVLALVLLAGRRIGVKGELPFGPAMLLGAALAVGWSTAILR